jgi:hypothetical protein
VVHCTSDQILIKSIASGPFQNGENIEVDGSNYVTSNTAPVDAIAVAEMGTTGASDTTQAVLDGFTLDAVNYVIVRAQTGHEAVIPFDTSRFYFDWTLSSGNNPCGFQVWDDYVRVEDLQLQITTNTGYTGEPAAISLGYDTDLGTAKFTSNDHDVRITNCVVKRAGGTATTNAYGIMLYSNGGYIKANNCVAYDFNQGAGNAACYWLADAGSNPQNMFVGNCIAYNSLKGFSLQTASSFKVYNCIAWGCTSDFAGSYANSNYNMSMDNSAPGVNSIKNGAGYPNFISLERRDFRIGTASDAVDAGAGPTTESEVYEYDWDGNARSGADCNMGIFEYTVTTTTTTTTTDSPDWGSYR